MARFRDNKTLQKFATVHASIHNDFNHDRHLNHREDFKQHRSAALAEWRQLAAGKSRPKAALAPVQFGLTVPPADLDLDRLLKAIAVTWTDQRRMLGFAANAGVGQIIASLIRDAGRPRRDDVR